MTKQTILIVEDEAEIREGIRILLSGENYSILEAENGEQALNRMSDQIDLVILDVMMPGISGLRVCEEIRKTSTVPILFLTAKAQESDKLIGLTAGGDDYLVKPFSYAELIARVKALLRRYCVYQGKGQPGATMPVLQAAQEIFGYLPEEVQIMVAEGLDIPLSEVYGVSTFYSFFTLNPKGKYQISLCLGTACYVKGASDVLEAVEKHLGICPGSITPDGKFSLDACRCIGACGLAPVMTVNDEVYGRLVPEDVDSILAQYMV